MLGLEVAVVHGDGAVGRHQVARALHVGRERHARVGVAHVGGVGDAAVDGKQRVLERGAVGEREGRPAPAVGVASDELGDALHEAAGRLAQVRGAGGRRERAAEDDLVELVEGAAGHARRHAALQEGRQRRLAEPSPARRADLRLHVGHATLGALQPRVDLVAVGRDGAGAVVDVDVGRGRADEGHLDGEHRIPVSPVLRHATSKHDARHGSRRSSCG